ncbi:MAG: XdhC family protein [Planctomycetes bacterium]|nr:XdhC family protein [Planctomycetota bacterium]
MSDIFEEIVALRRRGEPAALCTITSTAGSTPGKASMKMLVRADGSFVGTVGGGCVEAEVYAAAQEVLRTGESKRLAFALNERDYPDSGLICGGKVEIFIESVTDPTLVLFGAGHISSSVAQVAKLAGFRVVVGDEREAFATRERFPDAEELIAAPWTEQVARLGGAEHAFLVVVTRGHIDDGTVLEALFLSGAKPRYLGMIGSRAKRNVLFDQLVERGVDPRWLAAVRSPTGLALGARTHGEIAVAIVAQLIALRRLGTLEPRPDGGAGGPQ